MRKKVPIYINIMDVKNDRKLLHEIVKTVGREDLQFEFSIVDSRSKAIEQIVNNFDLKNSQQL